MKMLQAVNVMVDTAHNSALYLELAQCTVCISCSAQSEYTMLLTYISMAMVKCILDIAFTVLIQVSLKFKIE